MTSTLSPQRFDAMASQGATRYGRDKIIWTAGGIAARLGCGEDYVRRTLAALPGTPIKKKGRRLYAFEDDLIAWMRDGDAA
ncbi:hypothetical protein [Pelagibacterium halotolerans]|uniref:hypothetical protein n=1 Tax=Pelagibacterium halotolerans TaxID=531813 RepID=UPI0038511641